MDKESFLCSLTELNRDDTEVEALVQFAASMIQMLYFSLKNIIWPFSSFMEVFKNFFELVESILYCRIIHFIIHIFKREL